MHKTGTSTLQVIQVLLKDNLGIQIAVDDNIAGRTEQVKFKAPNFNVLSSDNEDSVQLKSSKFPGQVMKKLTDWLTNNLLAE